MLLYGNTLWSKGEIWQKFVFQRLIDNCERILQFNRIIMIIVKNFRKNPGEEIMNGKIFTYSSTNFSAAELMQYRSPVDGGPSLNT